MFTFYHNSYLLKVATKWVGGQKFQKKLLVILTKSLSAVLQFYVMYLVVPDKSLTPKKLLVHFSGEQ